MPVALVNELAVNTFSTIKTIARAVWFREGKIRTCVFGPYAGIRFELTPALLQNRMSLFYEPYEAEVTRLLGELVRPGMVVYDIGAHVGVHTLYMAKLLDGQGAVYAFEPWPENYRQLERNLRHNRPLSTVVVPVHQAVAAEDGITHLSSGTTDGRHHISQNLEEPAFIVSATTLDTFVSRNHPLPSLMKVDVEGMELAVLAGAGHVLGSAKPALILEHHKRDDELRSVLAACSYTVESLGPRHLYAY